MKSIALIFWPKGGNVEQAARKVAEALKPASVDLFDVAGIDPMSLSGCDFLILGGSTVGAETWQEASDMNKWSSFFSEIKKTGLQKKNVAFFGLGDQVLYPHHFVDGLGIFQQEIHMTGARISGKWPVAGYDFTESAGHSGDYFFGLALDEDRQPELTDSRIREWTNLLKEEWGID
ncbi:MAG: flavodoxin domain-containing protein [Bacteroidales bacterium]|nr:flavodoxin domain-containing protein [Bacteroidales bacterium]